MIGTILLALAGVPPTGGAAPSPVSAPGAASLVPLTPRAGGTGEACTGDRRWCVFLIPGEQGPRPLVRRADEPAPAEGAAAGAPQDDSISFSVWPSLLLLANGGFLAGVQIGTGTTYSGGGGQAVTLQLFETFADGRAGTRAVFAQPIHGALMIRACFSEEDVANRLDVCHDAYGFSATLAPAPGATAGLPNLTYATRATAFPRGVSRSQDSTKMRKLREADLVERTDKTCSYRRRFRYDPEAGIYRPDTLLPECSDFTDP